MRWLSPDVLARVADEMRSLFDSEAALESVLASAGMSAADLKSGDASLRARWLSAVKEAEKHTKLDALLDATLDRYPERRDLVEELRHAIAFAVHLPDVPEIGVVVDAPAQLREFIDTLSKPLHLTGDDTAKLADYLYRLSVVAASGAGTAVVLGTLRRPLESALDALQLYMEVITAADALADDVLGAEVADMRQVGRNKRVLIALKRNVLRRLSELDRSIRALGAPVTVSQREELGDVDAG